MKASLADLILITLSTINDDEVMYDEVINNIEKGLELDYKCIYNFYQRFANGYVALYKNNSSLCITSIYNTNIQLDRPVISKMPFILDSALKSMESILEPDSPKWSDLGESGQSAFKSQILSSVINTINKRNV
tara:strand:+ start:1474 stop:1872 length:399 start_codon:yes stop_codon:yes gene_type:complete